MLNISFKRTSMPITDVELLSVMDAIRPVIAGGDSEDKDLALLLARMVLRIDIEASRSRAAPAGGEPCGECTLNRKGLSLDEVRAHLMDMERIAELDSAEFEFELIELGHALRAELPAIAGRVSDRTLAVLFGICAAILRHAAKSTADDVIRAGAQKKECNNG